MLRSIEEQVEKTYFSLRIAAAVIGFAFPLILLIGGYHENLGLQSSMSAYYHANPQSLSPSSTACSDLSEAAKKELVPAGTLRNGFVGLLFAMGILLYVNKGHTRHENILLNVAGALAWCIALFPMPWICKPAGHFTMHGASAILFFLCIAAISIVCSRDTVRYLPSEKRRWFQGAYRLLAFAMVASMALAYFFQGRSRVFAIEFAGIYAFGLYWVVKTMEISILIRQRDASRHIEIDAAQAGPLSARETPRLQVDSPHIPADRFL